MDMPKNVEYLERRAAVLFHEYQEALKVAEPQKAAYLAAKDELESAQLEAGWVWTVAFWRFGGHYEETFFSEVRAVSYAQQGMDRGDFSLDSVTAPDGSEVEWDYWA